MLTKPFPLLLAFCLLAANPSSEPSPTQANNPTQPVSKAAVKKAISKPTQEPATNNPPAHPSSPSSATTSAKPHPDVSTKTAQGKVVEPTQGAEAPSVTPTCQKHQMLKDQIERKIRNHRGFSSFSSWQLETIDIKPCVHDGNVLTHLNFAAPAHWTPLDLPYHVWLTLAIRNDTGKLVLPTRDAYNKLVQSMKAAALVLEADIDIRRFVERYEIERVQIDKTDSADHYRFSLDSDQGNDKRSAYVTYDQTLRPAIVAYGFERMDGLPARRELLRAIDLYSMKFPDCRPAWYEVARVVDAQTETWLVKIDSHGKGCPAETKVRMERYGEEYNIVANPSPQVESHASGDVTNR